MSASFATPKPLASDAFPPITMIMASAKKLVLKNFTSMKLKESAYHAF